jgi:hypothetical protein
MFEKLTAIKIILNILFAEVYKLLMYKKFKDIYSIIWISYYLMLIFINTFIQYIVYLLISKLLVY